MRTFPPSLSPIARPIATIVGAFNGNSPARARMPSVPNNSILITLTLAAATEFDLHAYRRGMLQPDLRIWNIKVRRLLDMSLLSIEANGNSGNGCESIHAAFRTLDFYF